MADEVQGKDANPYAYWKILAWRFLRTGIAGGASTLITVTVVLKPDLSNFKEYGVALLSAFIAGFVGAAGLWIRDQWGNNEKNSLADKIII